MASHLLTHLTLLLLHVCWCHCVHSKGRASPDWGPVTGPGPGTPESALRVLPTGAGLCLHLKYVFEFKRAPYKLKIGQSFENFCGHTLVGILYVY